MTLQHAWLKRKKACEMTSNRKILEELSDPPPTALRLTHAMPFVFLFHRGPLWISVKNG
jgi:hypothetical protein